MMNEKTDLTPWTWREFIKQMKAAGWIYDGQGVFFHNNYKHQFGGWNSDDGKHENWREWAEIQQTPPPF